ADRFREHQEQGRRGNAQLHALHVFGLLDFFVGGYMALAIVEDGDDLVPGLVVIAFGEIAKQLAVAIGLPVVEVAQNEWRAGDRERLVDRACKRCASINDIDGAEPEALVDLVFIAELGGRKHSDFVASVGPFLDLVRRPERIGVIGLSHFVNVRPFELGLGLCRSSHDKCCSEDREILRQAARPVRHCLPLTTCTKPGGQRCYYALGITQRRSLRTGAREVHFLPTFPQSRTRPIFGAITKSPQKTPKDPAKPTRAKAARPDQQPTPDSLADLLNPAINKSTRGLGSGTGLLPPPDNSWDRRRDFSEAHKARKSTPKEFNEASQADFEGPPVTGLDPRLAEELGLSDEAKYRLPRADLPTQPGGFAGMASQQSLERLLREGRPEFSAIPWTPHRRPRPDKSERRRNL